MLPRMKLTALAVLILAASSSRAAPPPPLGSGWSVDALENRCFIEGLEFDRQCVEAVRIDMGMDPVVESVKIPGAGGRESTRYFKPEIARGIGLLQASCAKRHLGSCSFYASLLEGKHIPVPDPSLSGRLFRMLCARRDMKSCEHLAGQKVVSADAVFDFARLGAPASFDQLPPHLAENRYQPTAEDQKAAEAARKTAADADELAAKARDVRALCFQNLSLGACRGLADWLKAGKIKPNSPHELADAERAACIGGYKEHCVQP